MEWFVGGRVSELLGEEFCAFDAGGVVIGYDGDDKGANAADQGAKMLGSRLATASTDDEVFDRRSLTRHAKFRPNRRGYDGAS